MRQAHHYQRGHARQRDHDLPDLKHTQKIAADDLDGAESPTWRLFAQEYLVGTGKNCTRHFKRVEEADQALWAGVLNFWFLGRVFDRVRP